MPRPWNAPRLLLIVAMIPWPSLLTAESGVTVRPSFTVAEVFDDNLFAAASAPAADTISRFTPGLGLDYLGRALTLRSRYAFDAEYFARHSELTDQQMRRRGSINLRFPGGGPWGILVDGAYFETHVPGELNTETGVLSGRARARRLSFGPALEYRSDGGTTVRSGYLLTKDEVTGSAAIDTRAASLALERRTSSKDTVQIDSLFRRFGFEGDRTLEARSLTLGWTREATPRATFMLRAGPRLSEGRVSPEVSGSFRFRLRRGEMAATYAKSLTTIVGRVGTFVYESLAAETAIRPVRSLRLRLTPSVARISGGGTETRVYQANVGATWAISRWLSLDGSYQLSRQHGEASGLPGQEIARNVALLSLIAAHP